MISVFSDGLAEWNVDSRWAFKGKVDRQDQARPRRHFGCSRTTKTMKYHVSKFALFSLLILTICLPEGDQKVKFLLFFVGFNSVL